jgi:hypothetical protein
MLSLCHSALSLLPCLLSYTRKMRFWKTTDLSYRCAIHAPRRGLDLCAGQAIHPIPIVRTKHGCYIILLTYQFLSVG